jgi:hypothetical protein
MGAPVSPESSETEESTKPSTKPGGSPPGERSQSGGGHTSEQVEGSPREKPKKKHWVGIITIVAIVVVLLLWTLLSPWVMPPQGTTYVDSPKYASLGNYTGFRDVWAGNVSWGVSVSGPDNASVGTPVEFKVLVTKVSERPSNFFFRGLGISITNCTLWDLNGTYIAKLSGVQDLGFGKMAIINTTLPVGVNDLYVSVRFTEYEVMRLGFIPLDYLLVEKVELSSIVVHP